MKVMAVMRGVGFGTRDTGFVMLWFSAHTDKGSAALQCIDAERAIELLKKHQITDIKTLEGKTCWVELNDNLMKFVDFTGL